MTLSPDNPANFRAISPDNFFTRVAQHDNSSIGRSRSSAPEVHFGLNRHYETFKSKWKIEQLVYLSPNELAPHPMGSGFESRNNKKHLEA